MADETTEQSKDPIKLATELTVAWLSNPNSQVNAEDVPEFLEKMLSKINALTGQGTPAEAAPEHKPAVSVRASVKPDYLISLIDGRKLKSLKRHLSSHGLTPKEYRERYGLKPDYPMVAPNYSAIRRAVAEKLGLGRKVVSKGTASTKATKAKTAAPAKTDNSAKTVAAVTAAPSTTKALAAKTAKAPVAARKPAPAKTIAKAAAPVKSTTAAPKPKTAATPKPAVKAAKPAVAQNGSAATASRAAKKAPAAKASPASTKSEPAKS